MDEKIDSIRVQSKLNQLKNTHATTNWFKNLKNKKKLAFIMFNVEKFYPSIDQNLLLKALLWCTKYVDMSDDEIEVIILGCLNPHLKTDSEITNQISKPETPRMLLLYQNIFGI